MKEGINMKIEIVISNDNQEAFEKIKALFTFNSRMEEEVANEVHEMLIDNGINGSDVMVSFKD